MPEITARVEQGGALLFWIRSTRAAESIAESLGFTLAVTR